MINFFTYIVDRARASFKTKFGSMGLRDRGLRLAGYLTPPSDVTQEEEEANEWYAIYFYLHLINSVFVVFVHLFLNDYV